jgi:hypothetical protein
MRKIISPLFTALILIVLVLDGIDFFDEKLIVFIN